MSSSQWQRRQANCPSPSNRLSTAPRLPLALLLVSATVSAQTVITPQALGVNPNVNLVNLNTAPVGPPVRPTSIKLHDLNTDWYSVDDGCHIQSNTPSTITVDSCVARNNRQLTGTDITSSFLTLPSSLTLSWANTATDVGKTLTITGGWTTSGTCLTAPGSCTATATFAGPTTLTTCTATPYTVGMITYPGNCGGFHVSYYWHWWISDLQSAYNWGANNVMVTFDAAPLWCNSKVDTHYACGDLGATNDTWVNFLTGAMTLPVPAPFGSTTNADAAHLLFAAEGWNEFAGTDTSKAVKGWFDTPANLVTMMTELRSAVHTYNPAMLISMPSIGTGAWSGMNLFGQSCTNGLTCQPDALNSYMALTGACSASDFIAVHGELTGTLGSQQMPELQGTIYANVKAESNYTGACAQPIWDTEFSATANGIGGSLPGSPSITSAYNDYFALVGAYYARLVLMHCCSYGTVANYWFEMQNWPTMGEVDSPTMNQDGTINPFGIAYNVFRNWVLGATVSNVSSASLGTGLVYSATVSRPGGLAGTIAWWVKTSGGQTTGNNCSTGLTACPTNATYTVPTGTTVRYNLDGSATPISGGSMDTVGASPQFYTNGVAFAGGASLTNVSMTNVSVQ